MSIEPSTAASGDHFVNGNAPLIAHVIHKLQVGGMENGLVNLLNRLPQDHYRHAIICVTNSTEFAQRILAKNVSIHSLHKQAGKDPGFYWRFWRLMRVLKPAIVHTRNLGTLDLAPVAAAAGVPCRFHGEHGWCVDDPSGSSRKYRYLRRACDKAVSQYIVVSDDIGRWLRNIIGIPRQKIQHIYNGVDVNIFRPNGPRASHPPENVVSSPIVIGTVGRMDPIKGLDVFVTAISKLVTINSSLRDKLRFIIVGDGPLYSDMRALARRANVSDLVQFVGKRDDIPDILRSLDLFVLASINEGISNTILESMATGLPAVVTDVGGNGELVRDGITGHLVPANDSEELAAGLLRYVENESLRRKHGNAARERAKELFDLDSMVANYAQMYDHFLRDQGWHRAGYR